MQQQQVTLRSVAIEGTLLGMAVGDALGLPREGLSARRAERMFGTDELRHRFFFGYGMVSDDTEHTCMTAQAWLASQGDVPRFRRCLAWRLRWWLLGLPAGIGMGTLKAILKLWIGIPASRSGVRSAGNGPAMRAPILGVCLAATPDVMVEFVRASTRITHNDPRAEQGALAIAVAAAFAARCGGTIDQPDEPIQSIRAVIDDAELLSLLDQVAEHLARNSTAAEFARDLGLERGVTGYIYHTVPIALYCWLRHRGDFRASVEQSIRLGGDTDTVAGIVGALAGATVGSKGIPQDWLDGIIEWPCSIAWMRQLAERLNQQAKQQGTGETVRPRPHNWPGHFLRNLFFAAVVLVHGFRRLLPPY